MTIATWRGTLATLGGLSSLSGLGVLTLTFSQLMAGCEDHALGATVNMRQSDQTPHGDIEVRSARRVANSRSRAVALIPNFQDEALAQRLACNCRRRYPLQPVRKTYVVPVRYILNSWSTTARNRQRLVTVISKHLKSERRRKFHRQVP